jgi:large subunit ribosomal protein L17
MRKRVFGYQLSRDKNQRKALFRSLISALLEKGEIQTTLTKAKAIRSQTEKLITRAKTDSLSNRRITQRFLIKRDLVNRLFIAIAPVFKNKNGGYTRSIKTGFRRGDGAPLAKISFTEEILEIKKPVKAAKTVPAPLKKETKAKTVKKTKVLKKAKKENDKSN